MKKSLLLIPSLVTLSVTQFVALVSCRVDIGGGDKPEPTPDPKDYRSVNIDKESEIDNDYIESEEQTYAKGDKVVFVCDLNAFAKGKAKPGNHEWTFEISADDFQSSVLTYTMDIVCFDDKQLSLMEIDELKDLKEGTYAKYWDDEQTRLTYPCYQTIDSLNQKFYFYVTFTQITKCVASLTHQLE